MRVWLWLFFWIRDLWDVDIDICFYRSIYCFWFIAKPCMIDIFSSQMIRKQVVVKQVVFFPGKGSSPYHSGLVIQWFFSLNPMKANSFMRAFYYNPLLLCSSAGGAQIHPSLIIFQRQRPEFDEDKIPEHQIPWLQLADMSLVKHKTGRTLAASWELRRTQR